MTNSSPFRVFLLDDEPLALERLSRQLASFDSIQIVGSSIEPGEAIEVLNADPVDVLFLDIQMPGLNGFELLERLTRQPFVIFTTAYDQYALRAFQVNSIDYLVKPVEAADLERAIAKLTRLRAQPGANWQRSSDWPLLLRELSASVRNQQPAYPLRVASRVGERVSFLALDDVTHFVAQNKLTYAVIAGRKHAVDQTIAELELRLDPQKFFRIHRSALVNVDWVHELNSWFAGKVVLSLKDVQRTQLTVARDRVRALKSHLGI